MGRSVHSKPYKALLALLIAARDDLEMSQAELGARIGRTQSFVSKCERGERRLDFIEVVEFLRAMEIDPSAFVARFVEQAFERPQKKRSAKG